MTLLVHCYGGESRSRAVGAFAEEMLGRSSQKLFKTGHPLHEPTVKEANKAEIKTVAREYVRPISA